MEYIALLVMGFIAPALGIMNIRGDVSSIHHCNRWRVREEDRPKYGNAVGTGTLVTGASFVSGSVISFWSVSSMSILVLPAVVVGLSIILYGQFKYNGGLFRVRIIKEGMVL